MNFTVLGSSGFIGSHVAALAKSLGHTVECPGRDESLCGRDLGHVIYCIGITADFRRQPHQTVTAHVTKLQEVLTTGSFDSLVYLSSTRVYGRCVAGLNDANPRVGAALRPRPVIESTPIPVLTTDFSDLYNLSKLMGESIALAVGKNVKIARLSNVVGPDFESENFLSSVLKDCVRYGHVTLRTSLDSSKDYVWVNDVATFLLRLGAEGQSPIYNVCSGRQTSNAEIFGTLAELTGATCSVIPNAPAVRFPQIDNALAKSELGFNPRDLQSLLPDLVSEFRKVERVGDCCKAA